MTAQTAPCQTETALTDVTTHVFCCDRDRALCGHDISNDPEVFDYTPNDCIVCLDLEDQPCPSCGFEPYDTTV
ncbi:hypothetical protein [Streptomyces sp. NPDC029554]|uniref:hypothetical protein n=1 Tax=Streptomyces sp. NPDC029554 TaxID=3155126 RepID=UPI0033DEA443